MILFLNILVLKINIDVSTNVSFYRAFDHITSESSKVACIKIVLKHITIKFTVGNKIFQYYIDIIREYNRGVQLR